MSNVIYKKSNIILDQNHMNTITEFNFREDFDRFDLLGVIDPLDNRSIINVSFLKRDFGYFVRRLMKDIKDNGISKSYIRIVFRDLEETKYFLREREYLLGKQLKEQLNSIKNTNYILNDRKLVYIDVPFKNDSQICYFMGSLLELELRDNDLNLVFDFLYNCFCVSLEDEYKKAFYTLVDKVERFDLGESNYFLKKNYHNLITNDDLYIYLYKMLIEVDQKDKNLREVINFVKENNTITENNYRIEEIINAIIFFKSKNITNCKSMTFQEILNSTILRNWDVCCSIVTNIILLYIEPKISSDEVKCERYFKILASLIRNGNMILANIFISYIDNFLNKINKKKFIKMFSQVIKAYDEWNNSYIFNILDIDYNHSALNVRTYICSFINKNKLGIKLADINYNTGD